MRSWSMPVLISVCFVVFSTQLPVTLSRMTLNDVPDKWRVVSPGQPPQIEFRLFKSHTPEGKNWTSSVEYIISSNNNALKRVDNEMEENDKTGKESNKKIELGFRTIIRPYKLKCPLGQKRDHFGKCRDVLKYPYVN
ncbi:uncharacterized protein LOC122538696 isoform X1 [Frieseomelitta varia]|uniref:uncharacterized protein LOC122538696 isoform X1 n=1 Tax=Frieseomelitta varia TaxID=561572 RepID=UPI001CB6948E|nr:uncharacterized protein LOC122538696 isoform X1 [Frieseomelitta varia]